QPRLCGVGQVRGLVPLESMGRTDRLATELNGAPGGSESSLPRRIGGIEALAQRRGKPSQLVAAGQRQEALLKTQCGERRSSSAGSGVRVARCCGRKRTFILRLGGWLPIWTRRGQEVNEHAS